MKTQPGDIVYPCVNARIKGRRKIKACMVREPYCVVEVRKREIIVTHVRDHFDETQSFRKLPLKSWVHEGDIDR